MIQQVKRQIYFQPYTPTKGRRKNTDAPPTVTIYKKLGKIVFSRQTVSTLGMDQRFIAFYFDPTKKIIGWRIKDTLQNGETIGRSCKWKLVKTNVNGVYVTTITGIMSAFNGSLTQDIYKALEIKKYVETEGILERGTVYYFVDMKHDN